MFQVSIPIPALKVVNSYLIDADGELIIVDPGIGLPDSIKSLSDQLKMYGYSIRDIKHIVVTHLHIDHIGGAHIIQKASDAEVYINPQERENIREIVEFTGDTLMIYRKNLVENGGPSSLVEELANHHPGFLNKQMYSHTRFDHLVSDGEEIKASDTVLNVIWTPGHSRGHICLYLREKAILITGDHVLPNITPNIRIPLSEDDDPLNEYLESLVKLLDIRIEKYLPGHGPPSTDFYKRVVELQKHHINRLLEINNLLSHERLNIYEMATKMKWDIAMPWEKFPLIQKFFAFSEAAAHVRYLYNKGLLKRRFVDGVYYYKSILTGEELMRELERRIIGK